jgi:hypothetical protein
MWELVFHAQAADFAATRRGPASHSLRVALQALENHPLSDTDAYCRGESGRPHHVRHTPEFTIIFWVEPVVKEVRIVEISVRQQG